MMMITPNKSKQHRFRRTQPRFLLLVIVAALATRHIVSAAATTTGAEAASTTDEPQQHPVSTSSAAAGTATTKRRLRPSSLSQPQVDVDTTTQSLESIFEELQSLKSRIRSLEEDDNNKKESSNDHHDGQSRRETAATQTVTLAQFNQFKSSVNTQLTAINASIFAIKADLQKAVDTILLIGNKTEKNSNDVSSLDASLQDIAGRMDNVEIANESFTTHLATLDQTVAGTTTLLKSVQTQVDSTSQDVSDLTTRLACIDVSSTADDLLLVGCNVHIRNGAGQTESDNSKGNLIVGYNEHDGSVSYERSGSHNVVIGPDHAWTGYGGILSGIGHRQLAPYANLIGGSVNLASGQGSVAIGGTVNGAYGAGSVVAAGTTNMVTGTNGMAAAGHVNNVKGSLGVAIGGSYNSVGDIPPLASGQKPLDSASVVVGGSRNIVNYSDNVVVGGYGNAVPSPSSTLMNVVQVGGQYNAGAALDGGDVGVANIRFAD